MKQESDKNKCPRNFKLYAALVLGFGCMVIALAILDALQRGGLEYGNGLFQQNLQTVADISETQENKPAETPWLGMEIQDIDETIARQFDLRNSDGALVNMVVPGSPAANSGIKRGDAIVKFDHRGIKDASFLQNLLSEYSVGQRVQVVVVRGGDYISLYVKIGAAPASNENTDTNISDGALQWGMKVSPLTAALAQLYGIPESKEGVVIVLVQPGGRAALSGLQPGDLIESINSSPTPDMSAFISIIGSTREAVFTISRGENNLFIEAY
ncbi:PDZ domain-containing protein [candidate division KSB1 bacterium]